MQDWDVFINVTLCSMLKTGFSEVLPKVYVKDSIDMQMKIFRYLKTYHLLEMLQTEQFFIARRTVFSDKREKGYKENLRYFFALLPCGNSEHDIVARQSILATRDYAKSHIRVSCWTKDQYTDHSENYLKWKSFGEGYCRIETTLSDLLHSIDFGNMTVVVAPIQYKKEEYDSSLFDLVFTKTLEYKDEQEIRICLFPTDENNDFARYQITDIDRMIHEVTLSPFIPRIMNNWIRDGFETKFSFLKGRIQLSKIAEY